MSYKDELEAHSGLRGRVDCLNNITNRLHANISLADRKAATLITLNSGLIGIVVAFTNSQQPGSLFRIIELLPLLFLTIGLACFTATIWPRSDNDLAIGKRDRERQHPLLMSGPDRIDGYESGKAFFTAFDASDESHVVEELCRNAWFYAWTNQNKYRSLSAGLAYSTIGWFLTGVLFAILIYWPEFQEIGK